MHTGQGRRHGLIGKAVKRFLDLKLSTKFSLMFSGILLAVLIFTSLVLADSGLRYIRDRQDAKGLQSLEYVRILIEKDQRYLDGLIEYYISSTEAQELVNMSNDGLPVPLERTQELLKSARFKMYLLSVVFYNIRGEAIDFVSIDNSYGPVPQSGRDPERPFDRLVGSYLESEWEYIPAHSDYFMSMDHSPKLVLWKKMTDYNTKETIGAVAVSVDVRKLLGSDIAADTQKSTILLSHGNEVALNRTGIDLPGELIGYLCSHAEERPAVYQTDFNGEGFNLYYQSCAGTPFISCVIDRDSSSFWRETSIMRSALLIICVFLVAMLLLSRIFVNMLTRPLNKLSDSMRRFSKGDYGAKADFKYADDIGRLGRVFNNMVEENRRLVDLNYVLKLREKEAELSMLQMQINPHFLYNMLHTAYWSALKNHDEPTADIIYNLGQFFRLSLNRGGEMTSVRSSLDLVRHYLELQQYRFGSRIHWTIDADPAVYDALIPRLILQPIVENSIVHGMDSGDTHFSVRISAGVSGDGGTLSFAVEDNGVGFSQELLERWPDRAEEYFKSGPGGEQGGERFALRNIYERLRIRYQERCSFTLRNLPGGGAGVYLSIPNDYREV